MPTNSNDFTARGLQNVAEWDTAAERSKIVQIGLTTYRPLVRPDLLLVVALSIHRLQAFLHDPRQHEECRDWVRPPHAKEHVRSEPHKKGE